MTSHGKQCLQLFVFTVALLHLCMVFDPVSQLAGIVGFVMQVVYLRLAQTYPKVDLKTMIVASGVCDLHLCFL